MSAKTWMKDSYVNEHGPFGLHGNMYRRPWPQRFCADGSIVFEDGSVLPNVDVVMFCTGPSSMCHLFALEIVLLRHLSS
jgi:hypothetical protein